MRVNTGRTIRRDRAIMQREQRNDAPLPEREDERAIQRSEPHDAIEQAIGTMQSSNLW